MKKTTLLCTLLLLTLTAAKADDIQKCTYRYAVNGGEELYFDLYKSTDAVQPCVVYVFGGGFVGGSRDEKWAASYYTFLVEQGYKVIAIDYRLGLRPLVEDKKRDVSLADFRSMLIGAIEIAADDLLSATAYIVANAEQLGVDSTKIITCGSSAGAITVLQAEYEICNGYEAAKVLPEHFNYAGVIGFAGAILAKSGKFRFDTAPCPIMLFHGNSDSNVPYDKMSLMGYTLYGSKQIAKQLHQVGSPYWFYDAEYVNHSLAGTPQMLNREEITAFIERAALGGQKLRIHQQVIDLARPKAPTKFKIGDYIKSNFSRPDQAMVDEITDSHE